MQNLAQMYYRTGPMMENGPYEHSWFGLIWIVFWAVVIVFGLMLLYRLANHHMSSNNTRDPLDIAKERFARGEITKEELTEIKKELK